MVDIKTMVSSILLMIGLSVPGYILGKSNKLKDGAASAITVILTDISMPFLVFSTLLETDVTAVSADEITYCVLLPIVLCILLYFISKGLFKGEQKTVASNCFCSIFPNCGFLGIPLARVMFPENPEVCVLVAVFNVFSTFMLLSFGVFVLSSDVRCIKPKRLLFLPVTIALVLGVVCSYFGLSEFIPAVLSFSKIPSAMTTPLAMIILGYELSKLKLKNIFLCVDLYKSVAVRLFLSPLIGIFILIGLMYAFDRKDFTTLAAAIIISAGVPTAATAPAMAGFYGADSNRAALLTSGTTLFSIGSIPIIFLIVGLLI